MAHFVNQLAASGDAVGFAALSACTSNARSTGRSLRTSPAYLLPAGDHLHAIFPDWQGAPVLGGARSADLSNPAARM